MNVTPRASIVATLGIAGLLVLATIAWIALLPPGARAAEPTPATQQPTAREAGRRIDVYFSRRPESDDDLTAVFPVARTAPDAGVARAAIGALIAGPTPAETEAGYFSELGRMVHGPSNCGTDDFTIRIADGTATLRFCREVSSAGIGQDARAQSAIQATLTQFATVQRVRVLSRDGDCLFDMSGENRCLAIGPQPAPLQSF
jgi:spore germination protein GerM